MEMIKNVHELTDDELEECINGSTNIDMIREILTKGGVVDELGWVDPEVFADWFATGIEGYIDADVDSNEWHEANEVNWSWGYDIADNINESLRGPDKEE